MCQYCNHLNPSTEKDRFQCEACGRTIDQDYNAAVNLSRFACDPKLAKLALGNGNESEEDAQTPEFEDEEEDTQSLESDESGTNDL
jgi:transposase